MLKIMYLGRILILVSFIILSLITACASNQGEVDSPSSGNATQPPTGVSPPWIQELERGNPKLNGALVRLIEAEKRGEAESFARQSVLDMRDSSVNVDIYCVRGQAEAAAKAATRLGATMVSTYEDWLLGAYVPITSLDALANEKSIEKIEPADAGQPAQSN